MPLNYNGRASNLEFSSIPDNGKSVQNNNDYVSTSYNDEGDWFLNSFLGQLLFPGRQQEKEFGQQIAMQRELNEYNSVPAQMERWKEAGLNPFAFSGQNSPSAGSPPSAVGSGAAFPQAAAEIANAATGGAASLADAAFKADTLRPTIDKLRSDAYQALESGGLSKWQALSIETTLPLVTDNMRADYYQKLATIDKTWQEYENLKALHDNVIAELDLIIANTALIYSQEEVENAKADKVNEETRFLRADNDFWEAQGYRRGDPIDMSIRDMKANGKDPSFIGDVISDYVSKSETAKQEAAAAASWKFIPTTPTQAMEYGVNNVIHGNLWWLPLAKDGLAKIKANHDAYSEFKDAYTDAKSDLYDVYKDAKRKYREYKNSGASDSYIAQLKLDMEKAKAAYDAFTEEEFSNQLVEKISLKE